MNSTTRTIHLIGIGNVPAVPLAEVQAGDWITWNYGVTTEVISNERVASGTYELVVSYAGSGPIAKRKRGTTLVARTTR